MRKMKTRIRMINKLNPGCFVGKSEKNSFSAAVQTLFFVFFLLLPFSSSQGIIIRHDKGDSRYQVREESYPQLFYLHTSFDNKVCMGTLINSHWAITAAHCTNQTPLLETVRQNESYSLTINKKQYGVAELVMHPLYDTGNELENVDLALIRLDRAVVDITPVALYRQTDEVDQIVSLLGWGFTGIGTRGLQNNDGKFRRAQNRVTGADQWLTFMFDDPRSSGNQALVLEGIPGLGDSGGPALLEAENGPLLMGIALGELEEGESPPVQGLYGTTQIYERISSHLEWIDAVLTP
jgi:secreted trypsin-like serine protease